MRTDNTAETLKLLAMHLSNFVEEYPDHPATEDFAQLIEVAQEAANVNADAAVEDRVAAEASR